MTGITSALGDALAGAGPIALGLGWPLVSAGTLLVALGMAELASAFPTAGALYHWSALLGGAGWGWATAMLNLFGQIAIVAAIDLACAQTLAQTLTLSPAAAHLLFGAILLVHGVLNATSVRLVAWLNDASASVHIVGVLVLAALLFTHAAHPIAYVLQRGPTQRAGGSLPLGFLQSLVLGVWTFTGFDAAAHVSEETHQPERRAPFGIVTSVAVSAVAGFALVAGLTLAMKDLSAAAGKPDAALRILSGALGEGVGRAAMGLVVLAMWFAGLSSVTSASRMLFAFARDDGLPFAGALRRVSRSSGTPRVAIAACVALPGLLVAATASLSEAVFLAVATLATLALLSSYAVPIALGVAARAGGRWTRRGPFSLGAWGIPIAVAGVAWTGVALAACAVANTLAVAIFAGLLGLLAITWALGVKRRFRGPKVALAEFRPRGSLARAEEATSSSAGPKRR